MRGELGGGLQVRHDFVTIRVDASCEEGWRGEVGAGREREGALRGAEKEGSRVRGRDGGRVVQL